MDFFCVARQWLGRNCTDESRAIIMIDLRNAFNSVDRTAIMATPVVTPIGSKGEW